MDVKPTGFELFVAALAGVGILIVMVVTLWISGCARDPYTGKRALLGSCPDAVGWSGEGDYCYDGHAGPQKQIEGECCDKLRLGACPGGIGRRQDGECVGGQGQPIPEYCCMRDSCPPKEALRWDVIKPHGHEEKVCRSGKSGRFVLGKCCFDALGVPE